MLAAGDGHQLREEGSRRFLGNTATKEQYLALLRGLRPKPRLKKLKVHGQLTIQRADVCGWHLYNSLRRHGIASQAGVR
jgi:hypothetical protein